MRNVRVGWWLKVLKSVMHLIIFTGIVWYFFGFHCCCFGLVFLEDNFNVETTANLVSLHEYQKFAIIIMHWKTVTNCQGQGTQFIWFVFSSVECKIVRIFLCPCVGPIPCVGLMLTWSMGWNTSTLHYILSLSVLKSRFLCHRIRISRY